MSRASKKFGEITDAISAVPALFIGFGLIMVGIDKGVWNWYMLAGVVFFGFGIVVSYEVLQKLGVIRRKS